MKLNPHQKVYEEINDFSPEVQQYIWNRLQELKQNPIGHRDVENIQIKGRTVFKYVMKEGSRGGKKDHRAVFDIEDGRIRIFTVFHRDRGYQKQQIERRF